MAVGVSLTGHHINVISMDLKGTVLTFERMRRQFDLGCDDYIHSFSEMVKEVLKKDGITGANCLGVGISLPGLLSEDHKKVIYGKTFGFTGVTYEEITRYLKMPGQLFHDTYTSGYAEARARKDIKNAFYLILGVSVGGAVIVGRRVYEGDSGKAGEIGHILADRRPTAKRCYCGRKGCFDTLCRSSELDSYTDGNLEAFFQKLSEGDEGAEKRWKDYAKNLAVAVNNVHLLFDMPVILGGYVGMYMKEHIRDIRGYVDAFNPFGEEAEKYVLSCCSRLEPIAEGSARVYIDQFLENSSFE